MGSFFARLSDVVLQACHGVSHCAVPRVCSLCGAALNDSEHSICRPCLDSLPSTGFALRTANPLMLRMQDRVPLDFSFSAFYFRDGERLRMLIHDFKYHGDYRVAEELGREIGHQLQHSAAAGHYDYVVPVPLHPRKFRWRGYNQCHHLALGVAQVAHLQLREDILIRQSYGGSQTRLSAAERYANVASAFALSPGAEQRAAGRNILVVDDVFTTGATLEACINVLRQIPQVNIGVITLAYRMS